MEISPMANCTKCSAELIGSGKFCATCGAPVANPLPDQGPNTIPGAGSSNPMPSAAASSSNASISIISGPSGEKPADALGTTMNDDGGSGGYDPPSHVNPFAATASPNHPISRPGSSPSSSPGSAASGSGIKAAPSTSGSSGSASAGSMEAAAPSIGSKPPPPSGAAAGDGAQVSPLAVSNALSQRGAFQKALGEAVEKAKSSVAPPPPPQRTKKPGTQMMPNAPNRPPTPGPAAVKAEVVPPAERKKVPPPRTQVMGFNPAALKGGGAPQSVAPHTTPSGGPGGSPGGLGATPNPNIASAANAANLPTGTPSGGAAAIAATALPQSAIHGPGMPQSVGGPNTPQSVIQPSGPNMPQSVIQPSGPQQPQQPQQPHSAIQHSGVQQSGVPGSMMHGQPQHAHVGTPYPPGGGFPPYQQQQQPPQQQQPAGPGGPGGWGWNAGPSGIQPPQQQQQPQSPAYPYPFAYNPGSRVHVTWSNGQRYPATISQLSGQQCLVIFPDGQQHWVEMQYLSPG